MSRRCHDFHGGGGKACGEVGLRAAPVHDSGLFLQLAQICGISANGLFLLKKE
jgi:hypothetical protein